MICQKTHISHTSHLHLSVTTARIVDTAHTLTVVEDVVRVPEPLQLEQLGVVVPEVSPGPVPPLAARRVHVLGVRAPRPQAPLQHLLPQCLHRVSGDT